MKKILIIFFAFFICFVIGSSTVQAAIIFEYEIWMQAETSLDIGPIDVLGRVVNTGTAILDRSSKWAALGGKPSNLSSTTTGLEYVNEQLNGGILNPGESFPFVWLTGTQEQDLQSWSGDLLEGSFGLIPYGSDWHWTQGGFIPELLVHSTFVNGPADTSLPFNKVVINLETAGQYINGTPLEAPIPEPASLFLLSFGLLGTGFLKKKII